MRLCSSVLHCISWPRDTTSYQNKLELFILKFKKKGLSEIAFLNTTLETNKNKMTSPYSYDNEIMLKLIKCIIALTVYPSLNIATNMAIQRHVYIASK